MSILGVVDGLATSAARPSASLVLIMQDKQVFALHKKGFLVPAPFQYREMIKNSNTFYISQNKFSMARVKVMSNPVTIL